MNEFKQKLMDRIARNEKRIKWWKTAKALVKMNPKRYRIGYSYGYSFKCGYVHGRGGSMEMALLEVGDSCYNLVSRIPAVV